MHLKCLRHRSHTNTKKKRNRSWVEPATLPRVLTRLFKVLGSHLAPQATRHLPWLPNESHPATGSGEHAQSLAREEAVQRGVRGPGAQQGARTQAPDCREPGSRGRPRKLGWLLVDVHTWAQRWLSASVSGMTDVPCMRQTSRCLD